MMNANDGAGVNKRMGGRLLLRGLALGVSTLALLPQVAFAQATEQSAAAEATTRFNIPPQTLASAVTAFGLQSGYQVSVDQATLAGLESRDVSGAHTPVEALSRLLAGTGVSWRLTQPRSVSLFRAPQAAEGTIQLGTLRVEGASGSGSRGSAGTGAEGETERADRPYRTAGSSTYISAEKIERFRGTSTGDMLSGTPGVLNADNRNGAALDVNIRGMQGQGRSPVIVDGAQQEATVYRGYSGVVGRSYVDPNFIGEVIVEKGPSSAADGAGIIGGAVRMNTIIADDILLPGRNFGVRLKGGFNTNSSSVPAEFTRGGLFANVSFPNDMPPASLGASEGLGRPSFLDPTGGNGSIALAFRSEHIDLVGAFARRRNGNYHAGTNGSGAATSIYFRDCGYVSSTSTNPTTLRCLSRRPGYTTAMYEGLTRFRAGEQVLNSSQDNTSWLLKGTIRLADDHKLDLSFMRYESSYGEIMPSQIVWFSDGVFQTQLSRVEMNTYTARYQWDSSNTDLVNLKVNFWMTDNYLDIAYINKEVGRRYGVNVENVSAFDTGWGRVSMSYGGSYTYETLSPRKEIEPERQRQGNRKELSLFAAGEWKPAHWLMLNGSFRYSNFKSKDTSPLPNSWTEVVGYPLEHNGQVFQFKTSAERTAYRQENPGSTNLPTIRETRYGPTSFKGDGFAPMVSATVEPWDGIQFYSKYAEALRMPSLFETTRGDSTNPLRMTLRPEHAKTWEIGMNVLRNDFLLNGDSFRFKINYFSNNVDDYLTRISSVNASNAAPIANIDKASLRGMELMTSYDMGSLFGDFSWTRYTHTNFCAYPEQIGRTNATDLCYEGGIANGYISNQIPPKDSLSLTLGARPFDKRLTIGGRLTYIGERPTSGLAEGVGSGGTLALADWAPYTLVDVFASYNFSEHFQIDAAIDNLTDRYYIDTLTLGLVPSPGRTFRLNATVKF